MHILWLAAFILVLRISACATMCKGIALESLVCLGHCSGLYAESDQKGGYSLKLPKNTSPPPTPSPENVAEAKRI